MSTTTETSTNNISCTIVSGQYSESSALNFNLDLLDKNVDQNNFKDQKDLLKENRCSVATSAEIQVQFNNDKDNLSPRKFIIASETETTPSALNSITTNLFLEQSPITTTSSSDVEPLSVPSSVSPTLKHIELNMNRPPQYSPYDSDLSTYSNKCTFKTNLPFISKLGSIPEDHGVQEKFSNNKATQTSKKKVKKNKN